MNCNHNIDTNNTIDNTNAISEIIQYQFYEASNNSTNKRYKYWLCDDDRLDDKIVIYLHIMYNNHIIISSHIPLYALHANHTTYHAHKPHATPRSFTPHATTSRWHISQRTLRAQRATRNMQRKTQNAKRRTRTQHACKMHATCNNTPRTAHHATCNTHHASLTTVHFLRLFLYFVV